MTILSTCQLHSACRTQQPGHSTWDLELLHFALFLFFSFSLSGAKIVEKHLLDVVEDVDDDEEEDDEERHPPWHHLGNNWKQNLEPRPSKKFLQVIGDWLK